VNECESVEWRECEWSVSVSVSVTYCEREYDFCGEELENTGVKSASCHIFRSLLSAMKALAKLLS
jgi:hypothetical protein